MDTSGKRFRIAFSFAGEKRDFVAKIATILAGRFGERAILYDTFHEAEFAIYDLGIRLPKLYGEQSDLIVPVLCPHYDEKRWTGWEWLHIYSLLTKADGQRVMPCRFDRANAGGLSPAAGFIDLDDKTPEQAATLILERLALKEGKSKDHYTIKFLRICGRGVCEPKSTRMENHSSKFARRYDREFKQNAVALVEGGRSITEVARDLGVSHWSLRQWIKGAQGGPNLREPGTLAGETPEQRELRRLRQENDYLRRQRDILKKACGILSAEMPAPHLS